MMKSKKSEEKRGRGSGVFGKWRANIREAALNWKGFLGKGNTGIGEDWQREGKEGGKRWRSPARYGGQGWPGVGLGEGLLLCPVLRKSWLFR